MNNKINILLAEDDINLGSILKEFLEVKGNRVYLALNGEEGTELFEANRDNIDLVILDVMMPKKDGFTLAREIKEKEKNLPIIFLTARSMQHDVIEGLTIGADDYITKPFSTEELFLRINAIMRRVMNNNERKDSGVFQIGNIIYDYDKSIIVFNGQEQKLTTRENELMFLLCKKQNDILERSFVLEKLWGEDNYFNARSMDVYIAKLRNHLKNDPGVEIKTIHGTGYKLLC